MTSPPGHIGIVACSAEGAALCYRTICAEAAALLGDHANPEISLHMISQREYIRRLDAGDREGVGALMLASAKKLRAMGADFLICPDNTIHQGLPFALSQSPAPWLSISEVVAEECVRRGFRRVGVLGTRWLLASDVYPSAFAPRGIEFAAPEAAEREPINRFIMDELVYGLRTAKAEAYLQNVIAGLRERRCEAVVLGCTELPLILSDQNSPLPTLDSTRLLARAALERSVGRGAGAPG